MKNQQLYKKNNQQQNQNLDIDNVITSIDTNINAKKYQAQPDSLLNIIQLKDNRIHDLQTKNQELKKSIMTLADAYQQAKTYFEQQLKEISQKLIFKQKEVESLRRQIKFRNQKNYQNKLPINNIVNQKEINHLLRQSRSSQKALTRISIENKISSKNHQISQDNFASSNYFSPQNNEVNNKIYLQKHEEVIPYLNFSKTERDIHKNQANLDHNQKNYYQNFRTQRDLKNKQQEIEELTLVLNKYQQQKSQFNQKIKQFQRSQTQLRNFTVKSFKKDKEIEDLSKMVKKLQKKIKIKNKQIEDLLQLVNERFQQQQNVVKKQVTFDFTSQKTPLK